MRFVIALLIVVAASPAVAANCGFKPFAPFGCKSENARCVCDADGNCQWVFDCGR